jgi:hypothetical protein
MVDRFSSCSLLAVAAFLVAVLGLGVGAACDRDVRADQSNTGAGPAVDDDPRSPGDETNPVGGGPTDEADEDADGVIDHSKRPGDDLVSPATDPGPEGSVRDGQHQNNQPPQAPNLGEDDVGDHPRPLGGPDNEDSSSSPGGDGTGEEEAPAEDNWGAPVRGSGGDDPPDYIAPSDPKQV